jgi:hypothetical protein
MFSMSEIESLCDIPFQTLAGWVADGIVKPMKKGGKGPGNAAQFSKQQAIAFAQVSGLRDSKRGCEIEMVHYLMTEMAKLKWEVVEEWLGQKVESLKLVESKQDSMSNLELLMLFGVSRDEALEMGRRLMKVYKEIRVRVQIEAIRADSNKAS